MTDPIVWHNLQSAFLRLAGNYGDRLTASWISTPHHWYVLGPNADDADRERNRFISLAKRAGVHLGGGDQVEPLFTWLDHLRLKSANFKGGHAEGDVGEFEFGRIEHPCGASAECCLDLETDAMARGRHEALTSNYGPRSRNEEDPRIQAEPKGKQLGADQTLVPAQSADRGEVSPAGTASHATLVLLDKVLTKKQTTLKKWAADRRLGRSSVYDWKAALRKGKAPQGKVSVEKCAEIEAAIEEDARTLGLITRTSSD